MSANEKAEAILIVIKRLLKWALVGMLALAALVASLIGVEQYERWQRNKPRLLTEYSDIKLGDSPQQVRYVLGQPAEYLVTKEEAGNPWSKFPRVVKPEDDRDGSLLAQSKTWQYPTRRDTRIDVEFDKPGGVVVSVSCYSQTIYSCPEVFGLRDGTDEDYVFAQLGQPTAEALRDSSKVLRYNSLNLTLYLVKKKVYMIEVSAPASPS